MKILKTVETVRLLIYSDRRFLSSREALSELFDYSSLADMTHDGHFCWQKFINFLKSVEIKL